MYGSWVRVPTGSPKAQEIAPFFLFIAEKGHSEQINKSFFIISNHTDWCPKAQAEKFQKTQLGRTPENAMATIYISCVDNVAARFEIADILRSLSRERMYRNHPKYWMDFGNSQCTGQVILSTMGNIHQPHSEKYETVASLPFITDEFGGLLQRSEDTDNIPSCSLAEALDKQDLYINSSLAQMGCSLLWNMFRNGMTQNRGFFFNLDNFISQPLKVA
jgi:PRTRC genetic system ThiF family protein